MSTVAKGNRSILQAIENAPTPEGLGLQAAFRLGNHDVQHAHKDPPRHKRRREPSSDSSLIEAAVRHGRSGRPSAAAKENRSPQRAVVHGEPRPEDDDQGSGRLPATRVTSNDGNVPFQKRSRHKTRPDLYEPKAAKVKASRTQKQRSKKKSHRRRNRREGPGIKGIVETSSKYVSQERLTVRFRPLQWQGRNGWVDQILAVETFIFAWFIQSGPYVGAIQGPRT